MNLVLVIFGKKLILKHFMHRTIPKRCVLGVFWSAQYVSEVYFAWRRLLLTLLTYFYGYIAFGCIYILLTLKNKKQKISLHQLLYFGDVLKGISLDFCEQPRNVHFDLILFFHFPVKLVLPTYGPFSWSASHFQKIFKNFKSKIGNLLHEKLM